MYITAVSTCIPYVHASFMYIHIMCTHHPEVPHMCIYSVRAWVTYLNTPPHVQNCSTPIHHLITYIICVHTSHTSNNHTRNYATYRQTCHMGRHTYMYDMNITPYLVKCSPRRHRRHRRWRCRWRRRRQRHRRRRRRRHDVVNDRIRTLYIIFQWSLLATLAPCHRWRSIDAESVLRCDCATHNALFDCSQLLDRHMQHRSPPQHKTIYVNMYCVQLERNSPHILFTRLCVCVCDRRFVKHTCPHVDIDLSILYILDS